MQITGIILSGGQSTRMGTDKALLQINGKSLLENAIEICKPVCNEILISSNNPRHEKSGYQIIPDEYKNAGPLSGIYSCLKISINKWSFVISVDAAFVNTEFIKYLNSQTGVFDAIVPIHIKGKEPLISLYNKSGLTVMQRHLNSENFKMHNLLNDIKTNYVDSQNWVDLYPQIFSNLNRPEDF